MPGSDLEVCKGDPEKQNRLILQGPGPSRRILKGASPRGRLQDAAGIPETGATGNGSKGRCTGMRPISKKRGRPKKADQTKPEITDRGIIDLYSRGWSQFSIRKNYAVGGARAQRVYQQYEDEKADCGSIEGVQRGASA